VSVTLRVGDANASVMGWHGWLGVVGVVDTRLVWKSRPEFKIVSNSSLTIAGLWTYGYWRHVATGSTALVNNY